MHRQNDACLPAIVLILEIGGWGINAECTLKRHGSVTEPVDNCHRVALLAREVKHYQTIAAGVIELRMCPCMRLRDNAVLKSKKTGILSQVRRALRCMSIPIN